MLNTLLESYVSDKIGLEIGGPSETTGGVIYIHAKSVDNLIFSKETLWSTHDTDYKYADGKTGKLIINDAVNITDVGDATYDFIFSSHSLEHIANPLKALHEWVRIVKDGGYLILVLPERSLTFDHNRSISSFSTLLQQYEKNVGEDCLDTLDEILENHDLSMDLAAGNMGQFTKRSFDNFNNRCLHHYVYSQDLLKEICTYLNCEFVYTVTHAIDIWFIMKKITDKDSKAAHLPSA
jgi:Methyltransferase domain